MRVPDSMQQSQSRLHRSWSPFTPAISCMYINESAPARFSNEIQHWQQSPGRRKPPGYRSVQSRPYTLCISGRGRLNIEEWLRLPGEPCETSSRRHRCLCPGRKQLPCPSAPSAPASLTLLSQAPSAPQSGIHSTCMYALISQAQHMHDCLCPAAGLHSCHKATCGTPPIPGMKSG